jgi:hypothetical protein
MNESPQKGAPNDSGDEVEQDSTGGDGHSDAVLTAKQRTRYSSVTLEGKLAVRGPWYEAFDFATTVGKMMAPGGTFRTLLPSERGIAVVVRPSHRDRVLQLTGITARAWRSYRRKWEADRMAHRCAGFGPGGVTLFFDPQTTCPVPQCGATLPSERKERSAQAEAAFRTNGSSVPRNVLNAGDASRDEQGDAQALEVKGSVQEPSRTLQEGISESGARIRRERDLGLGDRDIAALLNQSAAFTPPDGFARWTGLAVRVAVGEASLAA